MKAEDLRGIYKEIALETDVETAIKIHKLLNNQQIDFSKKLYSTEYVKSRIKAEFTGTNMQELANKYGITKRRVRQILHSK